MKPFQYLSGKFRTYLADDFSKPFVKLKTDNLGIEFVAFQSHATSTHIVGMACRGMSHAKNDPFPGRHLPFQQTIRFEAGGYVHEIFPFDDSRFRELAVVCSRTDSPDGPRFSFKLGIFRFRGKLYFRNFQGRTPFGIIEVFRARFRTFRIIDKAEEPRGYRLNKMGIVGVQIQPATPGGFETAHLFEIDAIIADFYL